jgi:hypothetical protein
MASAFLGGFAGGLARSLDTHLAQRQAKKDREQDLKDWEWKTQKALQMEAEMQKTRPVKSEVFESNGQLMLQSYNASGEPVGNPVPAPPSRVAEYQEGKKVREQAYRAADMQIKRDENAMKNDDARTRNDAARVGISARELELNRARLQHEDAEREARIEGHKEETRGKRLLNDFYEQNPDVLRNKAAGRAAYDPDDKTGEWARVNAQIELVKEEDPQLADLMREAAVLKADKGKTSGQIYLELMGMKREQGIRSGTQKDTDTSRINMRGALPR